MNHISTLLNYFEALELRGYLTNCEDNNEKREFVDRLLEITDSSDYNYILVRLDDQNRHYYSAQKEQVIVFLGRKYDRIRSKIRSFALEIDDELLFTKHSQQQQHQTR